MNNRCAVHSGRKESPADSLTPGKLPISSFILKTNIALVSKEERILPKTLQANENDERKNEERKTPFSTFNSSYFDVDDVYVRPWSRPSISFHLIRHPNRRHQNCFLLKIV